MDRMMVEAEQMAQITFDQAAENFLAWSRAHHRAATTRLHQRNLGVLSAHFGVMSFRAVTKPQVECFKLARLQDRRRGFGWKSLPSSRPTVSVVSVNRALTTLKLLYNWAIRSGEYPGLANPAGIVHFRERGWMRVVSSAEEARYLSHVVSGEIADIARLMLETGMRPHEVMGLRAKDVDLNHHVVSVASLDHAPAVKGKTENSIRRIPVSAAAMSILWKRMAAQAKGKAPGRLHPEAFLFPSKSKEGHLLSVNHQHRSTIRRARISPAFRLYDLRHTFATRAAQAGVALPVLAALLGHSDITMTMRYVHPQAEAMRAAIRKMEKGARRRRRC